MSDLLDIALIICFQLLFHDTDCFFSFFLVPSSWTEYPLFTSYWLFHCPSFMKRSLKFQAGRNLCLPHINASQLSTLGLGWVGIWNFSVAPMPPFSSSITNYPAVVVIISVVLKSLHGWSPFLTPSLATLRIMAYLTSWHFPCDHSTFLFCVAVDFFHNFSLYLNPNRWSLHCTYWKWKCKSLQIA